MKVRESMLRHHPRESMLRHHPSDHDFTINIYGAYYNIDLMLEGLQEAQIQETIIPKGGNVK